MQSAFVSIYRPFPVCLFLFALLTDLFLLHIACVAGPASMQQLAHALQQRLDVDLLWRRGLGVALLGAWLDGEKYPRPATEAAVAELGAWTLELPGEDDALPLKRNAVQIGNKECDLAERRLGPPEERQLEYPPLAVLNRNQLQAKWHESLRRG